MDNYKLLKKLEVSFENKLNRKLNKVFKDSNVNFKIKGCCGPMYFNDKQTTYTLFWLGCVRGSNNFVVDFTYNFQIEKQIPQIVLDNKQVLLDILNSELKEYFDKKVGLY